jgi:hypothetical protein
MKITKLTRGLVLATIASGVFAVGCELIVDFDRTRIPVEASEASIPDGSLPETSTGEGGALDAAPDATDDATASDASDAAADG